VLDEFAYMAGDVRSKILRPALADREGRATFISSVNGRNEFYRIYKAALEAPDEWSTMNLRASSSGLLPPKELAALRGQMSEGDYQQEYENDFDVAAKGSYYGKLVSDAEAESSPRRGRADRHRRGVRAVRAPSWITGTAGDRLRINPAGMASATSKRPRGAIHDPQYKPAPWSRQSLNRRRCNRLCWRVRAKSTEPFAAAPWVQPSVLRLVE
jgi:hypothetical protein